MTTQQALTDAEIRAVGETIYGNCYTAADLAFARAVLALHRPEQAEKDRNAMRYLLLREWCVRGNHRLYVTDGNNPVYEEELDRRLDVALAPHSMERKEQG